MERLQECSVSGNAGKILDESLSGAQNYPGRKGRKFFCICRSYFSTVSKCGDVVFGNSVPSPMCRHLLSLFIYLFRFSVTRSHPLRNELSTVFVGALARGRPVFECSPERRTLHQVGHLEAALSPGAKTTSTRRIRLRVRLVSTFVILARDCGRTPSRRSTASVTCHSSALRRGSR